MSRFSVFFALLLVFWPNVLMAETESLLPRPDTVTMIDLGAKSCVPCKINDGPHSGKSLKPNTRAGRMWFSLI